MNERLKEIVKQARLPACHLSHPVALERFAELVRAEERQGCAEDYLKIMRDAVAKEREACAALVEADGRVHPNAPDAVWAKTVARLIRARGKK